MKTNRQVLWEKTFPPCKDKDEEDLIRFQNNYSKTITSSGKFISGPYGIVPIDHYDIWVGHTNFILKDHDFRTISQIEGVEACKGISRYRFEICIGKLFDRNKVQEEIDNYLCQNTKHFAVVKHQGKVLSISGISPAEIQKKLEPYGNNIQYIKKSW